MLESETLEHVREATAPVRTMHRLYQVCLCARDTHKHFQYAFYAAKCCSGWNLAEFLTRTAIFNNLLTLDRHDCLCLLICVTKQRRWRRQRPQLLCGYVFIQKQRIPDPPRPGKSGADYKQWRFWFGVLCGNAVRMGECNAVEADCLP